MYKIIYFLLVSSLLAQNIEFKKSFSFDELDYFDLININATKQEKEFIISCEYLSTYSIEEIGIFHNEILLKVDNDLNKIWELELPKNYNRFSSSLYVDGETIQTIGSYTKIWQNFVYANYRLDSYSISKNGDLLTHNIDTISEHSLAINTYHVEKRLFDKSYLSISAYYRNNEPNSISIKKYNQDNLLMFEKFIDSVETRDTLFRPRDFIELNNGDIILLGEREVFNSEGSTTYAQVYRLNKDYELIWKKSFDTQFNSNVSDIILNSNGNIVFLTNLQILTSDFNSGERPIKLLEIDTNGAIIVEKSLGFNKGCNINSVIETDKELYVLAGFFINNQAEIYGDYYYMVLDKNFNLVSEEFIEGDFETGQTFVKIIQSSSDKYLLLGSNNKNMDIFELDLSLVSVESNNEINNRIKIVDNNIIVPIKNLKRNNNFSVDIFNYNGQIINNYKITPNVDNNTLAVHLDHTLTSEVLFIKIKNGGKMLYYKVLR